MADIAWDDMTPEQRDQYVEEVEQELRDRYGPDE